MHTIVGAQPYFFNDEETILEEILSVLNSGNLTEGEYVRRFEQEFEKRLNAPHALAVSSGGTALELIFEAIGVRGKEVIVSTDTFVATVFAVIRAGGKPVLCDVDQKTLAINPTIIEPLITNDTVAVVIVHMFGIITPDLDDLKILCTQRHLAFIEDAAHAHGASYHHRRAGTLGDAAAFSFYSTKIITTGEGGMVTTGREDIYHAVRQLRTYGRTSAHAGFTMIGMNARLAEIPSILGYHQLQHLDEIVAHRNRIAQLYLQGLRQLIDCSLLGVEQDDEIIHGYWRFPFFLSNRIQRPLFQQLMADRYNVRVTWMYEPLCHLQPILKLRYGYQGGEFSIAEECMRRLVCLPTHMGISEGDVQRILRGVQECLVLCKR